MTSPIGKPRPAPRPKDAISPDFRTACILAGGQGRRLEGVDKLFISLHGQRLVDRIIDALQPCFSELLVATRRPEAFTGLPVRCIEDRAGLAGPLAGLAAGLAASGSPWLYLIAVDMPYFNPAWVRHLQGMLMAARGCPQVAAAKDRPPLAAVAASGAYFEPFQAFYHRSILDLPGLSENRQLGSSRRSIQALLRSEQILRIDPDVQEAFGGRLLFQNINTIDDLRSLTATPEAPILK